MDIFFIDIFGMKFLKELTHNMLEDILYFFSLKEIVISKKIQKTFLLKGLIKKLKFFFLIFKLSILKRNLNQNIF